MRVYVGGTFDLFHAGHVELLRRAKKHGEVWIALNSDYYVEEFKGKRPIMDYWERAAVLLACEYVEMVMCNDGIEDKLLETILPRTIVYANDGAYTRPSYLERLKIDERWLDSRGVQLVFLDYTEGVSSTDIVNRILDRSRRESPERIGSSQGAGEPDVPDGCPCGDVCSCQRSSSRIDPGAPGGLSSRQLSFQTEPGGLGSREAGRGAVPCN